MLIPVVNSANDEEQAMSSEEIMYVELKSGYSDNGPAGLVE
ncbi:MAG: hypothetical protein VCD00_19290 [Candidatus Hydrogenedentota bacterium]